MAAACLRRQVAVALWEVWATRSVVQALWAAAGCPQGGTFHSAADHTDWKEYRKGNPPMSKTERRPRLTAARKFELYLATRSPDAPLGEILRQYGVHLDDLRAIEQTVESSALAGLKAQARHGRLPTDLSPERVQQLEQEVAEKTRALAELSVSYTVLEKKERAESRARARASARQRRGAK
jgi:hypothetical protein